MSLTDEQLSEIHDVDDLRKIALDVLDLNTSAHYASGANDRHTLHENIAAFRRLRLRPRVLTNVENVDTSTSVIGKSTDRVSFSIAELVPIEIQLEPPAPRVTRKSQLVQARRNHTAV